MSEIDRRLQILQAPGVLGVPVREVCRRFGVSPETFYAWRRRLEESGVGGLAPRSRRPLSSPTRIDEALAETIRGMRRAHDDWGAKRIGSQLRRAGLAAPSDRTIHRVLVQAGLVTPRARAPKGPWQRFVRERPNELWQMDDFEADLSDGSVAHVFLVEDDHSRLTAAARAFAEQSCEVAWSTFQAAAVRWGLPQELLTDWAAYFTGQHLGAVVPFERAVWQAGVATLHGKPRHPQTRGKVERLGKTAQRWLADHGPNDTIAQLQAELDRFVDDYNHHRPHQELGDDTPFERWSASPRATPIGAVAGREFTRAVTRNGTVRYSNWEIHLGRQWAGTVITVLDHIDKIRIVFDDQLLTAFPADHPKGYIASGRTRGHPPTRRVRRAP
jgi:transposase InsO family protein